jgi:hypothetical protein
MNKTKTNNLWNKVVYSLGIESAETGRKMKKERVK